MSFTLAPAPPRGDYPSDGRHGKGVASILCYIFGTPWHVLIIREWRSAPPKVLHLAETFATKPEAEAAARECEAGGPHHARCLRETCRVVQSPEEVEFSTCKNTGNPITIIKRADLLEPGKRWIEAWEAKQAKR